MAEPHCGPPQTSPLALLARASALAPDAPALVAGDLQLDYRAYGRAVAGLAAQLRAMGAAGGRVALLLGQTADMAVAGFAAQGAGAAAVPLNPASTPRELKAMIDRARPAIVITRAAQAEALPPPAPGVQHMILPDDTPRWLDSLPPSEALHLPHPDEPGLVQFTGGTTGAPKGVVLSHRALAVNVWQREAVLPTRWADERVLCVMPLHHSFASAMAQLLCANCAGTLVLLPRYHPETLQAAHVASHATRLPAGPTLLVSLMAWGGFDAAAWSRLRCVWSGSAPLPPAVEARWRSATGVPVFEGYGQTEAGPVLTFHGPGIRLKPGSVGPPLPHTEIAVADLSGGAFLPAGATGEIVARGPQIMEAYLDEPEATARALAGGWLRTGDVGHRDEEGYLFITDRLKDMAIVSGYNVYPREVDDALTAHDGVRAAAAVAVADAYRGEVLAAFYEGDASPEALEHHARALLAPYKRPASYTRLEALPRTGVGKVDKGALRRLARSMRDEAGPLVA